MILAALLFAATAASAFDHSHAAWGRVLEAHWRAGLVDYEGLHADPSGLDAYLESVAAVDEGEFASWTPRQRLAFWINAHNAFAVKAVVDHYPLRRPWWRPASYRYPSNSARQIEGFSSLTFTAARQPVSLDEIRVQVSKLSDDPRAALALSCACQGGPGLPGKPVTAQTLDAALDAAARSAESRPEDWSLDELGSREAGRRPSL